MTLSAFGYVSGSDLWQIARSQTSFPIGQSTPSAAFYTSFLLIVSGIIILARPKLGLPIAAGGVLLFGVDSYSSFGTFPGVIPVSILPGLGFFLGCLGIIIGIGAARADARSVICLFNGLRTRAGFGQVGILVTSVFLTADGWSHWSTGEFSAFLGTTLLEGLIHRAFMLGAVFLLMIFLVQKDIFLRKTGAVLVIATFGALLLDAFYHVTIGSIVEFVGHDPSEALFHGLTYYGIATLIAARFYLKR